MRVKDAMTSTVVSVSPNATIAEALDIMIRLRVSGLPVVDKAESLVGMISEGDFLRRSELGSDKQKGAWIVGLFAAWSDGHGLCASAWPAH